MEEQANRSRDPSPEYRVGDRVWLNLKNVQTPQPHVVELDVPSRIFPRFHVELLRKSSCDPLPSQKLDDSLPDPILIEKDDRKIEPEQEVERVLRAERFRRGGGWVRRVLVKWKGFAEPNWEDRSELEDVEALDLFEAKFGTGDGVGEEEGARQGLKKKKKKSKRGE